MAAGSASCGWLPSEVDNAQTGFYAAADRSSSIDPKIVPLHYRYDLQAAGSQASESVLLNLFCSLT